MCADDVPLIGRVPGRTRTWLATGHGMMGIGMSVGTGELIADLVASRTPSLDPAPYDPKRFT
jgi:D-amino-acid dehydrogenase